MNAAKKLADAFLAQDCTTAGCTWKDHGPPKYTPGEITIVPDRPPDAAHKGQKGLFWEATAKVSWSATAYCYPTQKARDAGKDARETAEKKAKEEEEKSAKPAK